MAGVQWARERGKQADADNVGLVWVERAGVSSNTTQTFGWSTQWTPGPSRRLALSGTAADDTLSVSPLGNRLSVGRNSSLYSYPAAAISSLTIDGLGGNDSISTGRGLEFLLGVPPTMMGGTGNDAIHGGSATEVIYGGDGNDTVSGNDGSDTIYGNFGDDIIMGGLRRDLLLGGIGDDVITAGDGPDTVYGGDGNDVVRGGKGADHVEGRGKADTIYGGDANDTIHGGAGSDLMFSDEGDDTIYAGVGALFHDTIDGGAGYDQADYDDDDSVLEIESRLLV